MFSQHAPWRLTLLLREDRDVLLKGWQRHSQVLSGTNWGVNMRRSSGMLVRVLLGAANSYWHAQTAAISSWARRSGPTLSIAIQLHRCLPCPRCRLRRASRRRRAAHPVCQGVTSAACVPNLIPAVSPTRPACPSISGVVSASVCTPLCFSQRAVGRRASKDPPHTHTPPPPPPPADTVSGRVFVWGEGGGEGLRAVTFQMC